MHLDISHIFHNDIKDKKSLFVSTALRLFWWGLMTIFIPGLLYISTNGNLQLFFLFYIAHSLVAVLLNFFFTRKLINEQGTKVGMLAGLPFLVLFFFCIAFMESSMIYFWGASLAIGVFISLFWTSFHVDISQANKQKKFWSKLAWLQIIIILTSAIAPLLGGWIIDTIGIVFSLILAAIFILWSGIPLLTNYRHHRTVSTVNNTSFYRFIRKNIFSKYSLGFAIKWYSETIASTFWPLFLFLFFYSFTKVGGITAATTLIVSVLLYRVGKKSDQHQESFVMKISTAIQSANWFASVSIFILGAFSWVFAILIDIFQQITLNILSTVQKS